MVSKGKDRVLSCCAAVALLGTAAAAQNMGPDHIGELMAPKSTTPPAHRPDQIRYGKGYWQTMSLYLPKSRKPAPLVVVAPDWPWPSPMGATSMSWVPDRLMREGFAVAYANLPVMSRRAVEDRLMDFARGVAELRRKAAERGIDPDRILILGSASGGHFATLLGTDETYFERAGVPFASVVAVASINGDGFDLPRRIATAGAFRAGGYRRAVGHDVGRQARLSPVSHLAPPNAPRFLFMAEEDEATVTTEALEVVEALRQAGISARFERLPKFNEEAVGSHFLGKTGGSGQALIEFFKSAAASPP